MMGMWDAFLNWLRRYMCFDEFYDFRALKLKVCVVLMELILRLIRGDFFLWQPVFQARDGVVADRFAERWENIACQRYCGSFPSL